MAETREDNTEVYFTLIEKAKPRGRAALLIEENIHVKTPSKKRKTVKKKVTAKSKKSVKMTAVKKSVSKKKKIDIRDIGKTNAQVFPYKSQKFVQDMLF